MQNFTIKYWFDIETGQYVVEVPELNISDYWETIDIAYKNLQDWLNLYFEEVSKNLKSNKKEEIYA